MKFTWWILSLGVLAAAVGCDDTSTPSFQAQIVVEPGVQGNAPMRLQMRAVSNGPLDGEYRYAWQFGDGSTSEAAEPEHVFSEPGTYTVGVTVSAGGAAGTATQVIEVGPSADLRVSDVGFSPRRTEAGGEIEVAWVLANAGAPVLGPWRLQVVLSADETFDSADTVVFERRFEGDPEMRAEGSTPMTLPADLASGDWYVGVIADPEAAVGDLDRADNQAWAPFTIQVRNPTDNGPDLVSCGLSVPAFDRLPADQTPVAQMGDQLPVEVCVANLGNGIVAVGDYGLFLSRDAEFDAGDLRVGGRGGFALGAGDQQTFDDLVDLPLMDADGAWHLLVVADPDEQIGEQREDNNGRAWPGQFELAEAGAVDGVDLVLTELVINEDSAFWGQQLTGSITLVNRGNTAVERSFVVRVYAQPVDGTEPIQLRSLNRRGIAGSADEVIPLQLPINQRLERGDYRLFAEADPTNSTDDVNPSNNRRTLQRPLALGGEPDFDLVVGAARVSTDLVQAGASLDVQATTANPGTDASGGFEAVVFISADEAFDGEDRILDRFEVASLDPDGRGEIERTVVIPADLDQQVPAWFVGVALDPANRLRGERAEDNNVDFAGPVTVEGATGGCAEDGQNEPNDVREQAAPLAVGSTGDLGLCDDADWFEVQVPAGQVLEVVVSHGAEVTPRLRLADAAGNELAAGEPRGDDAQAAFVVPSADDRAVLIELTAGGARTQYALDVALSPAGEQPNLRVRGVAVVPGVAEAGALVDVGFELLNVGGADAAAFDVAVTLETAQGGTVALDTADVAPLAAGAARRESVRVTLPEGLADDRYTIVVTADAAGAVAEADEDDNQASGRVRVDADQACQADPFEPNGSGLEGGEPRPAPLGVGVFADLTACAGDDDWYAVTLEAGQRLNVSASFDNDAGDLDLVLYGPDGTSVLDRSAGFQNTEAVQLLRAPADDTYFVRVYLNPANADAVSNTYRLDVAIEAADACVDDGFEPNGGRESAALLPDGSHDLTLCAGDEDWFRFNIPVGNTVSFQVASGAAGVRIALFGPDGALIDEDARRITHEALATGIYSLRAQVAAEDAVPYSLTVSGVSGVDLAVESVRLSSVAAEAGQDLRADVVLANTRGDDAADVLVRYLLSADELPSADDVVLGEARVPMIPGAGAVEVNQRLSLPGDAPAGPLFVVVDLDPERDVPDLRPGNNRGAAALDVVAACVDDDPRSNEGPRTATPLDAADETLEDAVICAFTEDWFRLALPEGAATITLTFDHGAGDLDLQVWDAEANTLLGESRTEADMESVDLELPEAAEVLIRVDGFLDARNRYTLGWTLP